MECESDESERWEDFFGKRKPTRSSSSCNERHQSGGRFPSDFVVAARRNAHYFDRIDKRNPRSTSDDNFTLHAIFARFLIVMHNNGSHLFVGACET